MQAAVVVSVLLAVNGADTSEVRDLQLLDCVRSHELVIRARVVEIGVSPGHWSGVFVAVQKVKYVAIEVYKGDPAMKLQPISANHVLVGNGPLEDREPGLRKDVLKPGVEVVLFASPSFPGVGQGIYVAGDDPWGVLLVHGDNLAAPVALSDKTP